MGVAQPPSPSTVTLYFDVVGDVPNSVVYNDGTQDLLVWVPGAAEGGVPGASGSGPADSAGTSTEIIDNAPVGAAESGGDMAAPAEIAPPPEVVSPFETPEQHDRGQ